jgi:hypothetical protein
VCPAPRRIEVAAIKRDQSARGFKDRIGLICQSLTAGFRKPRGQPANRFELADQHGGRRRGSLTDLIECQLGEALQPHWRHPDPEPAASVIPVPFERRPLGERQQRVGEPVDASNAGVRIVDRGRQRADPDLNHLRDAELAILSKRAVTADVYSPIDRSLYGQSVYRCTAFSLTLLLDQRSEHPGLPTTRQATAESGLGIGICA